MSLAVFSERLAHLMSIEGVSKRALSIKAEIQRRSLLNWLAGKNYPRYDSLVRLADYFNVRTDYLLGLDNNEDKFTGKSRCPVSDIPAQFRVKLNRFMNEAGITKYRLAKKVGVGQTTLERWFSGGAMPDVAVLIRLTVIIDETLDYLLGRE